MADRFALPQPDATGAAPDGTSWSTFGAGEPLVLIHGVGMQQAFWAPQVNAMSDHYRVVTYDMWGHGGTPANAAATDLDAFAAQLAALLDHLGVTSAHVVGHSLGALVALQVAGTQPDRVRTVTCLNAVYQRTPEQRAPVVRRAEALARDGQMDIGTTLLRWFGEPGQHPYAGAEALSRHLLESVDAAGYATAYMTFATADQPESLVAALPMPAMFATGDGDPNSTPAMSKALAAAAPRGAWAVVEGARHMMSLTHPDEVDHLIVTSVESQDPQRSTP